MTKRILQPLSHRGSHPVDQIAWLKTFGTQYTKHLQNSVLNSETVHPDLLETNATYSAIDDREQHHGVKIVQTATIPSETVFDPE